MDKPKFYITTSIMYANAKPHVGFALELVQADAIARYKRLRGFDVYFVTGTDEHGTKILEAAKSANLDPQDFVDRNADLVQTLADVLQISYTDFIRTTDKGRHWPAATAIWQTLTDKGYITKGHYTGWYSVNDEAYITATDAKSEAYANKKIIELSEDNYLFDLPHFGDQLIPLLSSSAQKNPHADSFTIIPEHRAKEITNFILTGLNPVSFSRPSDKLPWGIPVPGDDTQVMYVWCDALTNYLSALGFPADTPNFKKFWPADIHVIGKDILRFHAAIWPAMLLGAGLPLPKKLLVHGHVLSAGQKMSKSLGNVVDPITIIEEWGVDPLRYYLLKEIPTTEDGDYSAAKFSELYISDLANDLGNLVSRILAMVHKYYDGILPEIESAEQKFPIINQIVTLHKAVGAALDTPALSDALHDISRGIAELNKFIQDSKPWADEENRESVLYVLVESLRHISILLQPFLPETAGKIRTQIGLTPILESEFDFEQETKWGGISSGHQVSASVILFPRKEDI